MSIGYLASLKLIGKRSAVQIVPSAGHQHELLSDPAYDVPQAGYPLVNHGGPVIKRMRHAIILCGPSFFPQGWLDQTAAALVMGGYLDPANETIDGGHDEYVGSFQGPTISGTVSDAQIQSMLQQFLQANASKLPPADGSSLYTLMMPRGVTVMLGNDSSCSAFCGYHDSLPDGKTFYTVQIAPDCQGCLGSFSPNQAGGMILGHEIVEAKTDPVPGEGWCCDPNGPGQGMENADEDAWDGHNYGPLPDGSTLTVQGYMVNGVGKADYGQYHATATPQPSGPLQAPGNPRKSSQWLVEWDAPAPSVKVVFVGGIKAGVPGWSFTTEVAPPNTQAPVPMNRVDRVYLASGDGAGNWTPVVEVS